jgi:hypothetical protein
MKSKAKAKKKAHRPAYTESDSSTSDSSTSDSSTSKSNTSYSSTSDSSSSDSSTSEDDVQRKKSKKAKVTAKAKAKSKAKAKAKSKAKSKAKAKTKAKSKARKACKLTFTDSNSSDTDESEDHLPVKHDRRKTQCIAIEPSAEDVSVRKTRRLKAKHVEKDSSEENVKKTRLTARKRRKKSQYVDSDVFDSDAPIKKTKVKIKTKARTAASGSPDPTNSSSETESDEKMAIAKTERKTSTSQSGIRKPEAMRLDQMEMSEACEGNVADKEIKRMTPAMATRKGRRIEITPPPIDPQLYESPLSRNQWSRLTAEKRDRTVYRAKSGYTKRWTGRASGKRLSVVVTDRR